MWQVGVHYVETCRPTSAVSIRTQADSHLVALRMRSKYWTNQSCLLAPHCLLVPAVEVIYTPDELARAADLLEVPRCILHLVDTQKNRQDDIVIPRTNR